MTVPEQAGKVASSAIDALRGSPGLLVLVLLQVVQLGVLYFAVDHNRDRQQDREMALIERCVPNQKEDRLP